MIVISYDIQNDKLRNRFSRMISKNGAIRLQYSVYEVNNTKRVIENLSLIIEKFSKHFSAADSVILFEVDNKQITKYGSAIHRDKDVVFL